MRRLAALFIPLVFVVGACTKETDTPEKKETIEPFFVKATVSGNAFTAIDSGITFDFSHGFSARDGQQGFFVRFKNTPEVKTYTLSTDKDADVRIIWNTDYRSGTTSHASYSGELEVTSYEDSKIRGTFKGSAKKSLKPESDVEITSGSFFVYLPN